MEKLCGIYCIENKLNHKKYIGKSIDIYHRWKEHKIILNRNNNCNTHFQNSWNKYGEENFLFYIVELCKQEDLDQKEIFWIESYNTTQKEYGYNMTKGGTGGNTLLNHSKEEIKEINKKRNKSIASTREINLNNGKKAQKLTKQDVYEIIDLILSGFTNVEIADKYNISYSTINDIRCHHTWNKLTDGYVFPPSNGKHTDKSHNKAVKQYSLDGEFIKVYESARIAEKETGVGFKQISQVCNGDKRQAHGFIWRFLDDEFDKYPINCSSYTPVDQYDKDGTYINTYSTMQEANNTIGIGKVNSVIYGKCKTAGGYYWCRHGEKPNFN